MSKSHAQKLIVAGKTLSAVVSVMTQDTLIELMHWHEVHDVTKNKFTRIAINEFLLFKKRIVRESFLDRKNFLPPAKP